MAQASEKNAATQRKYGQLLRVQERLLSHLLQVRDELDAPTTARLISDIRRETGRTLSDSFSRIASAIEEAMRAIQLCQSELQGELMNTEGEFVVDGITNLPPPLARFLAERIEMPGFQYEIIQDPIRGWIIRWKEHTERGTVRGHGQFYERPYAWLDEV